MGSDSHFRASMNFGKEVPHPHSQDPVAAMAYRHGESDKGSMHRNNYTTKEYKEAYDAGYGSGHDMKKLGEGKPHGKK